MQLHPENLGEELKSALFVDFDNAYLGLERLSFDVASRFGNGPRQWLRWLTEEFPCSPVESGEATSQRRVLIRRCYLNPVSFWRFRRPFLEAGFDVIDCPPMTAAGKTSTDVHMVLDMVDALQHPTGFDEFIVFSADADFSPVLRRLRTNNRQTVVFAAGNMSDAYRASADFHIDVDNFIFDGLGYPRPSDESTDEPASSDSIQNLEALPTVQREDIAKEVELVVKAASDPVPLARLAAHLNRKFGNLAASKWIGAGTFSDLLTSLKLSGVVVEKNKQLAIDATRQVQSDSRLSSLESVDQPLSENQTEIGADITAFILDEISKSDVPVKYVRMAQLLGKKFPKLKTDWMGYHSFSDFVSNLRLGALQLSILPNSQDRIIFDPVRHSIDGNLTSVSLAASILRTAKLPQISAIDYCSILNVFWVTLKDEAFDITASSNSTYALCIQWEKKPSISLQAITSLLQGLVFNGFDPRKYYASPEDLMVDSCAVVLAEWARQNLVSFVDNDTRMKFMDWVKDGAENAIRLDRPAEAL